MITKAHFPFILPKLHRTLHLAPFLILSFHLMSHYSYKHLFIFEKYRIQILVCDWFLFGFLRFYLVPQSKC